MEQKYESVLVVDDHNMIANGIKLLVGDYFENFYTAHDGAKAINIALQVSPKLIIVDYVLPDTSGDLLVRELKYKLPAARILGYSFTHTPEVIVKMLLSGVNGYVIKTNGDDEFVKAVQYLMNGRDYYCKEARNHIVNKFSTADDDYQKHFIAGSEFSGKDIEIIKLLCKQMNTKEISKCLHLSERTIEQYRSRIMRRMKAKNLAGVIKFALQNGIIQLDDL